MQLDELLQELLDRVSEVMASRERLRSLLDAVVGIGTDLDLRSTLERIVAAACRLADARYGALGPDDRLVEFITHGMSPEQHAAIGALPDELHADLLAVVREALSNVVRHAAAGRVQVRISVDGGQLSATVTDDGTGGAVPRGGLLNLAERAALHGGWLTVEAADPAGTVLQWCVPVR